MLVSVLQKRRRENELEINQLLVLGSGYLSEPLEPKFRFTHKGDMLTQFVLFAAQEYESEQARVIELSILSESKSFNSHGSKQQQSYHQPNSKPQPS
jgi:hypothetical protein